MWDLSEPDGEAPQCFLRLPQYEFYREESNYDTLELMPGFSELPKEALVPNSIAGITYNTVNTDAPIFLNYLLSKFLASGGSVVKSTVNPINQVIEGGAWTFTDNDEITKTLPSAIINCLGLGARVLGGVEDHDVYPVRGQTVLIRAPWIQRCMSLSGGPDKIWTYIIPRRSGDVIIGGTYEANDWYVQTPDDHRRPLIKYPGGTGIRAHDQRQRQIS
jgi:glycine/D-amino acid oxidase-like deaminating enzyme